MWSNRRLGSAALAVLVIIGAVLMFLFLYALNQAGGDLSSR